MIYANIYTGIGDDNTSKALAIGDGHILFVGDEEAAREFADEKTRICHFEEAFVCPGFFEAHAHPTFGMRKVSGVDLSNLHDKERYKDVLVRFADEHKDEDFIYGQGFAVDAFGESGPEKEFLDRIFPGKAVAIWSDGCHDYWVNSEMLKRAGITKDTPDPDHGKIVRDANGEPTGFLLEAAGGLAEAAFPPSTVEAYKRSVLSFQDKVLPHGTTSLFEPLIYEKSEIEKAVRAYTELRDEGRLKLRVHLAAWLRPCDDVDSFITWIDGLRSETGHGIVELDTVKLFMDDVLEEKTAYLREDYDSQPGYKGECIWESEALTEACIKVITAGYSTHTHAIGDGAAEAIITALERAIEEIKLNDRDLKIPPQTITHLQVLGADQAERMARAGIVGAVNTYWHYLEHSYYYSRDLPYLGRERAEKEYPMKTLIDAGVVLTMGSDWPVSEPPAPLNGMEIGITRREPGHPEQEPMNEDEKISADEMLRIITVNGAVQTGDTERLGGLKRGNIADFVVLNKDPRKCDPYEIHDIKICESYINGKKVYESL